MPPPPAPKPTTADDIIKQFGGTVSTEDVVSQFGGTIEDGARPVRITHPVTGVTYDVPAGKTPEEFLASIEGAPPPEEFVGSLGERVGNAVLAPTRNAINVGIGAVQGAANTVLSSSKFVAGLLPGEQAAADVKNLERLQALPALQPQGWMQKGGYAGEQIAEMFAPGAFVSKLGMAARAGTAAKVAATTGKVWAGKVAGTLARGGVEAAGGAAMATAQGGDPTLAGGLSGAIPVVGAGARLGGRAVMPQATPYVQKAIEGLERAYPNFPIDLPTRTGARWLRGLQNLTSKGTIGGGIVGGMYERTRQQAARTIAGDLSERALPTSELAGRGLMLGPAGGVEKSTVGEGLRGRYEQFRDWGYNRLATQLHPTALTRDEAGTFANQGVMDAIADQDAIRKAGYKTFDSTADADTAAKIAAGEEGTERIPHFKGIRSFTDRRGFSEVLAQARRDGYTGTPEDLAAALDRRKTEALEFLEQQEEGNLGKKILKFIAAKGGINRFEPEGGSTAHLQGEVNRLWEMTDAARRATRKVKGGFGKQQFKGQGGLGGVTGVVNHHGKSVSEMAELLRTDPEFAFLFDDVADTDLIAQIENAALEADKVPARTVGQALAEIGVRPGTAWWDDANTAGNAAFAERAAAVGSAPAAKVDPIGMATDIRALKRMGQELLERLNGPGGMTDDAKSKSEGLKALEGLLAADDVVPAGELDNYLSELKKIVRETRTLGGGTNRSGATAATLIDEGERALAAGLAPFPEAAAGLQRGRAAVKERERIKEFGTELGNKADQDKTIPAGESIMRKLVGNADIHLPTLQRLQQTAPDEIPKLARAWMDDVVATEKYENWDKLGIETKKILFGDPKKLKQFDTYFERAAQLKAIVGSEAKDKGKLFDYLTQRPDLMRRVRKTMPDMGRAYLDDLFGKATREEGFKGEQGILAKWRALSPEAKRIMFPNPQVRQDIDHFFTVAEKSIEDLNRPGSGYMAMLGLTSLGSLGVHGLSHGLGAGAWMMGSQILTFGADQIGFAAMSAALHSPKTARMMTRAMEMRVKNPAGAVQIMRNVANIVGGTDAPAEPEPPR